MTEPPDRGGSGSHVIPPRRSTMLLLAAGFSAAGSLSMLLGECDIGGVLAAIAFVFGLIGSIQNAFPREGALPDEGGSGSHVIPPQPIPPTPAPVLETGATGALLASLFALQVERCPLATILAAGALILLILALLLRPRR